jgi:hypothetical protein
MAGYLNDEILDAALSVLDTATADLRLLTGIPASRAEAVTQGNKSCGYKTGITISAPADRSPNGRKVTVAQITDGVVACTGTVTASHWAIVDATRLLAWGELSSTQSVTNGNTFGLAAFDIGIPDVV